MKLQIHLKKEFFKKVTIVLNKNIILTFFGLTAFLSICNLLKQHEVLGVILLIGLILAYLIVFLGTDIYSMILSLLSILAVSIQVIFNAIKPYVQLVFSIWNESLQNQYIIDVVLLYSIGIFVSLIIVWYFDIKVSERGSWFEVMFDFKKAILSSLLYLISFIFLLLSMLYFVSGYPIQPYVKIAQAFFLMAVWIIANKTVLAAGELETRIANYYKVLIVLVLFAISWGAGHILWQFNLLHAAPQDMSLLPAAGYVSHLSNFGVFYLLAGFFFLLCMIFQFSYVVYSLTVVHKIDYYLEGLKEIGTEQFIEINKMAFQAIVGSRHFITLISGLVLVYLGIYLHYWPLVISLIFAWVFYSIVYGKYKQRMLGKLEQEVRSMKSEDLHTNLSRIFQGNFKYSCVSVIPQYMILFIGYFFILFHAILT